MTLPKLLLPGICCLLLADAARAEETTGRPAEAARTLRAHVAAVEKVGTLKDAIQSWAATPSVAERLRVAKAIRSALLEAERTAGAAPIPEKERELYEKFFQVLAFGWGETVKILEAEAAGRAVSRAQTKEALRRAVDNAMELTGEEFEDRDEIVAWLPDSLLKVSAVFRPAAPLVGWTRARAHIAARFRMDGVRQAMEEAMEEGVDTRQAPSAARARFLVGEVRAACAEALRTASGLGLRPAELALYRRKIEADGKILGAQARLFSEAAANRRSVDAMAFREALNAEPELSEKDARAYQVLETKLSRRRILADEELVGFRVVEEEGFLFGLPQEEQPEAEDAE